MRDYPQAIAETNRIEPAPRRVRGVLGGEVVFDTSRALYVWESEKYPQYYIPLADVNGELLVDEEHPERLSRGTALRHGLRVGEVARPGGARLYTERLARRPRGHDALQLGCPRCLVRGRRGGLRPSAQSVRPGRCAAFDAPGARRARRCRPGCLVIRR